MTDIVIPSWITPEQEDIELLDDGTTKFEPQFGRGQSQRQSYGAPRFKISRRHTVRQGEEAGLVATLSALRGGYHTVRTTVKRVLRGSFGLAELVTNGTFASGTSGWSTFNSSIHTVADRVSKFQVGQAQTGSLGAGYGVSRSIVTTAYTPYVARAALFKGLGPESYSISFGSVPGAGDYFSTPPSSAGLITAAGVSRASSAVINIAGITVAGNRYEDFVSCGQVSASKCCLVDNGSNLLTFSNEFDNAIWTKTGVTITQNAVASYDLTTTADALVETAANSAHSVNQVYTVSSAAQDIAFTVAIRPSGRTFVRLQFSAATVCSAVFNLSGAGSVSSVTNAATWTDTQGFIQLAGGASNPFYLISMVSRKADSSTAIASVIQAGTDASTFSYAGSNGTTALYASDATTALSSVPTRLVRNTTAQAATSQSGSAIYLKGVLPISTAGLALAGDYLEIGGELKRLTAPLNSSGLATAYAQFEPEIVRAPSDNDPVIFFEPFGRFVISNIRMQPRVSDVQLSYDLEQIYE